MMMVVVVAILVCGGGGVFFGNLVLTTEILEQAVGSSVLKLVRTLQGESH